MEILETDQDAFTYFNNYAKKLNGGESYFMKSVNAEELQKVDPNIACDFFNSCYLDPSSFVVILVGDFDASIARPLIEELLGGIPKPAGPVIRFQRDNLTPIPFNFPPAPVREEICRPMAGSKCCTKVTFPVNLRNSNMDEDEYVLDILRELIRIVVLGRLRYVEGQIYEVLVEQSHDGYNFARAGLTNSSITVEFITSENTSYLLADAVVEEILKLQNEGPSQNDMLAVFGAMDGVNKDLAWWCDEIGGSYQSGIYRGILDDAYEA